MTDKPPRDGVPPVEELIAITLLVADSAQKSLDDCQLVREETRSALKKFETTNGKMLKDLAVLADDLKQSYTPSAVQDTVQASQIALREFNVALGRLDKTVVRVTGRFAVRIATIIVLVVAVAACTVWLLLQRVPTLTEIADRQATLHRLQEQIDAFESLKGHLVRDPKGQRYIRYDEPPSCVSSNPNDGGCYIPIPK